MFPDISEHQGSVDWAALGAAFQAGELEAVMMRAGFGTVRADHELVRNQAECRARGIPALYYWFCYPQFNAPNAEAAMFNATVGTLLGNEAMCGDFEDDGPYLFPRGQAGADWAKAFLSNLQAPQNATWWYTYPYLLSVTALSQLLGAWPFWLADYSGSPDSSFTVPIARQFTNCGSTPGVGGCCDQSRLLRPPLQQWLVGGIPDPPLPPPPPPPPIVINPRSDAMLVSFYANFQHLFYVDAAGALQHLFQPPGGFPLPDTSWHLEPVPGAVSLPPGALVSGDQFYDQQHLYVERADGKVLHSWQSLHGVPDFAWHTELLPAA